MSIRVHLINPSHLAFGVAVITPRWLYVLAAATPPSCGDPVITDETLEPLDVESVSSSYFDDASRFPKGTVDFDCALLMQGIPHEWHGRDGLCCANGDLPPVGGLTSHPCEGHWP